MDQDQTAAIEVYPEEFLIACGIHQLRPEDVLQQFVNRFFYSVFLCGAEDDTEHAVNEVIYDYLCKIGKGRSIAATDSWLHTYCKMSLTEISDMYWMLPDAQLKKIMHDTMIECCAELREHTKPVTSIAVVGGYTINLPNDFIMMCFLYEICPASILQHLTENISLAYEAATAHYGLVGVNPFMGFFHSLVRESHRYRPDWCTAHFYHYELEMLTLHENLQEERNFEKRLSAMTKNFKNWYEATCKLRVKKVSKGYSNSKPRKAKAMT